MKKILSLVIVFALIFSFAACENGGEGNTGTSSTLPEQTNAPASTDANEADATDANAPSQNSSRALVVYFSATGNTKSVAETLAGIQDADIFEIVPAQPYTDADLNYNNRSSRATVEQNDSNARPAISGNIENLDSYDVIYVGYPIWWGDMPRILYTFFDAYDFSGKTIAPFCTSGGSGLSGTGRAIAQLEANATVLDGLHVSSSASSRAQDEVTRWLSDIGLSQ